MTKKTKIEQWQEKTVPIASLKPYGRNPRKHGDADSERLKSKIERFGYHQRMLVTEDMRIIGGHLRLKELQKLGVSEVAVLVAPRKLTDDEYRELLITDNLHDGSWDAEILAQDFSIEELEAWGADTDWSDVQAQMGNEGLTDPDEVPPAPDKPVSVLGDMWLLGSHRLRCGDSTKADDVAALLGDVKPHLMVTDPPYGVEYDPEWRDNREGKFGNTGTAKGKVLNDDRADWREAWALFPGDVAYVWHSDLHAREVVESLEVSGFIMRAQIIWAKSQLAMSRGHYHFQHEPCWYAVRKGKTGHWAGDRKQSTLWQIDKPAKSETGHSTQKPVECMKRPIENNSSPGQAVYEPFSGSGTTIIAGEMTGRSIYAMELSPQYCDMAVQRYCNFTGKEATHAESGEKFNVLAERQRTA